MQRDWGYVYAIAGAGKIKIGITREPDRRLRGLQMMCPVELDLVCHRLFPTSVLSGQVERMLHVKFQAHRWRGEWFNIPREVAAAAIEEAHGLYGDPKLGPPAMQLHVASTAPDPDATKLAASDTEVSLATGANFGAFRAALNRSISW